MVSFLLVALPGAGREIRIPDGVPVAGTVLIAERFVETVDDEEVPIEFSAWLGDRGLRPSTWFTTRIEAHPGDVLTLAPGSYDVEIWIFTDNVTIRTDPEADELAWIRGTIEIDADEVVIERIGVTDSVDSTGSGHGFEVQRGRVNRLTIRSCRAEGNRWTGIHMIGASGGIEELRVEDCRLIGNGMDGMDASSTKRLVVTGCTITGNGWDQSNGVGVRIGCCVEQVEMSDNLVEGNRFADVYRKE
jgi:hypothetical protein